MTKFRRFKISIFRKFLSLKYRIFHFAIDFNSFFLLLFQQLFIVDIQYISVFLNDIFKNLKESHHIELNLYLRRMRIIIPLAIFEAFKIIVKGFIELSKL